MGIFTDIHSFLSRNKCWLINTIAPVYGTKRVFYYTMGKQLNLKDPKDINEKIQDIKLNDYRNNPVIGNCSDKYEARRYLTEKGYESLLPKLYGVYFKPSDIKWSELPDEFVVKCTHGSGYNIICPDKSTFNTENAERDLRKWLKEYYGKRLAEVQYKSIKRRIIVEEYLGSDIEVYKFFCFNGEPRTMYVSVRGENGENAKYLNYYNMDWELLDIRLEGHENSPYEIEKPADFEEMKNIAKSLSRDFKFVRVDLYNAKGKVYFSELTFTPTGGLMKLKPEEILAEWGRWLRIN